MEIAKTKTQVTINTRCGGRRCTAVGRNVSITAMWSITVRELRKDAELVETLTRRGENVRHGFKSGTTIHTTIL